MWTFERVRKIYTPYIGIKDSSFLGDCRNAFLLLRYALSPSVRQYAKNRGKIFISDRQLGCHERRQKMIEQVTQTAMSVDALQGVSGRLPQESGKAFAAFELYREMGVERSIAKVAQKYNKSASYIAQLNRWSGQHGWVKRAAAWDDAQSQAHNVEMNAHREALIDAELADYEQQLANWRRLWDTTQIFIERRSMTLPDGTRVQMSELNIDGYIRLAEYRHRISALGRRAMGLPDKIVQSDVTSGGKAIKGYAIVSPDDWVDGGDTE